MVAVSSDHVFGVSNKDAAADVVTWECLNDF